MFIIMFRTIILYSVVVVTMRLMGKKQIGQLQPLELAIAIMISDLASLPMQDTKIPLINGIIPILTLLILEITLSFIQLKNEKARLLLTGEPSIIIKKGTVDINELSYQKYTINDLMEELRLKGYYNIEDIEYGILETSGQLSVFPKADCSNVIKSDLNIKIKEETLPVTLVLDGKINDKNLKIISKDRTWLYNQLKENRINNVNKVFIAMIDSQGKFQYQERKEDQ